MDSDKAFQNNYVTLAGAWWRKGGVCVEMNNPQSVEIQLLADCSW